MAGIEQAGPKHLVAGTWRIAFERARLAAGIGVAVVALLAVVIGGRWAVHQIAEHRLLAAITGAFLVAAPSQRLAGQPRTGTNPVDGALARLWWRARWPWDARAGGLVAFAERGLIPNREFTSNVSAREVAPRLETIEVTGHGRRYFLRPLPGQALDRFEAACAPLALRWRATQVTARIYGVDRRGRGLIVLDVIHGDGIDAPLDHPEGIDG